MKPRIFASSGARSLALFVFRFSLFVLLACPLLAQEVVLSSPLHYRGFDPAMPLLTVQGSGNQTGNITEYRDRTTAAPVTWMDFNGRLNAVGAILSAQWLNNVCMVDVNTPGADAGAKIATCWAAMPTGGTTDARGLLGAQSIPSTVVLNKPGSLLLPDGPFTLPTTGGSASVLDGGAGFYAAADNVRIIGNGHTVLQAARTWADGSWAAVGAFGVSGFEARGLDIQITVTGAMPIVQTNIQGVWVKGAPTTGNPAASNFTIENNRLWTRTTAIADPVKAKPAAIFIYSQHATLRATGGVIKGNILDDSHGRGIYLYRAHNVTIADNIVKNLGATLTATDSAKGIRIIGSTAIAITGNSFSSSGTAGYTRGISIEGDTPNTDIAITGNPVYFSGVHGTGSQGIFVENASWVNITGNPITYTGDVVAGTIGIQIGVDDVARPVSNILVNSNQVRGWTAYQIQVPFQYATDILVADNMIGRTIAGAASYWVAHPAAVRVRYVENIEGDTPTPMTRIQPSHFYAGLLVGSTSGALANRLVRLYETYTSPTSVPQGLESQITYNEPTAPNANAMAAISGAAVVAATNTQNLTSSGGLSGIRGVAVGTAGAAGTVSNVQGFLADNAYVADGTWTNYSGFRTRAPSFAGGGAITNLRSFKGDAGAGIAQLADGIKIADLGTTITKHLSATASLDFTALAANTCETLTIPLVGAADGDTVTLGVPTALADVDGATERTTFFGWVSAADVVSVRRCNPTLAATADPAAATVRADVWQH